LSGIPQKASCLFHINTGYHKIIIPFREYLITIFIIFAAEIAVSQALKAKLCPYAI